MKLVEEYEKTQNREKSKALRTQDIKAMILAHAKQMEWPPWFRGTSTAQRRVADTLQYSLRDDIEQESIYRTRECLTKLGLRPVVTDKLIKQLMDLSRGNDLAFLWFLWEIRYKTTGNSYSVNEQLLLSYIAHLDMITTLRELDRILPPPQKSKRQLQREQRNASKSKISEAKRELKRKVDKNEEPKLPYLRKQRKPIFAPKIQAARRPDFVVKLETYDNYKNRNYTVPNEDSRWYANYQFSPVNRIARTLVKDEIDHIPWFNEPMVTKPNDEMEKEKKAAMCAHHRGAEKLRQEKHDEKLVAKREYCRAYLDPEGTKAKRRQQLIQENLEKEVERIFSRPDDQGDFAWINGKCCEKLDFDCHQGEIVWNELDKKLNKKLENKLVGENLQNKHNPAIKRIAKLLQRRNTREYGGQECDLSENSTDKVCPTESHRGCDHCPDAKDEPQQFFTATTTNLPFKFNHDKIFQFDIKPNAELDIRKNVIDALSYTDVKWDEQQKANIEPVYEEAVTKIAQKIWKEQVEAYQAQIDSVEAIKTSLSARKAKTLKILGFEKDYYDPDDAELMTTMLKNALAHLAQNPKFVLASLPDAHNLPNLRYWIARRYGKRYTFQERCQLFHMDEQILSNLHSTLRATAPFPTYKTLGTTLHKGMIPLKCPMELKLKAKQIRFANNALLHEYMMEFSRNLNMTMRSALCSGGKQRSTFYAYMLADQADIQHYKLWKPNEYRDMRPLANTKAGRRHQ